MFKKIIISLLIIILIGNLLSCYAIEFVPDTAIMETGLEILIDTTNYSEIMISAAINGDIEAGIEAEQKRNIKIEEQQLSYPKINFNDLFLVAKIITAEAGSSWLSEDWKMSVGEVLLNRVASPEFPNTIEECLYQTGQYYSKNNTYFKKLLPWELETRLAWRLLSGERIMEPSVVFQANFKQGSGIYKSYYDKYLGYTYFCYTSYPELYKGV